MVRGCRAGSSSLRGAALSGHAARAQVSSAMGFGFRCGFLGLLHMEIVQERLEREYNLDLIITAPTVVYRCRRPDGAEMAVDNPCNLPDKHDNLQEPYCRCGAPSQTLQPISVQCRLASTTCLGSLLQYGPCLLCSDRCPAAAGMCCCRQLPCCG